MDVKKVETGEVKVGTVIRIIWDILDDGFQVTRLGEVVEINLPFNNFIVKLEQGDRVEINKSSTLWEIF